MSERTWRQRLRRLIFILLATGLIFLAAVVGAFRLLLPLAPDYREQIADWAGDAAGWPVVIEEMDLRWRGLVPEMVFSEVALYPEEGASPFARAEQLRVRFSLLDLVRPGPLRPGRVVVSGADFALVRTAEGEFTVPGLELDDGTEPEVEWREVLERVLARADYRLEDSRLRYRDDALELGPWRLGIENLDVHSVRERHEFALGITLPEALGGALHLEAAAEGPSAEPEEWDWQGALALSESRIGLANRLRPEKYLHPFEGRLDLEAAVQGRGPLPDEMTGSLQLSDFGPRAEEPVLHDPDEFPGLFDLALEEFRWTAEGDGWHLSSGEMAVHSGGESWPTSGLELSWQDKGKVSARLRYAEVEHLSRLVNTMATPEVEGIEWLDRLRPRGELRDLSVESSWEENVPTDLQFRGRVSGAGFAPWDDKPGMRGISGWIQGDLDRGDFDLDAGPVRLYWPDRFREPVEISRAAGELEWWRDGERWHVASDEVRGHGVEGVARAEGEVSVVPGDTPHLDIRGELLEGHENNATRVARYLPVDLLDEEAVEWLDQAFVAGTVTDGHFEIEGTVEDFPYEDDDGRFVANFNAEDGILHYEDGWPQVTGIRAGGLFHNTRMSLSASTAEMAGFEVEAATAEIVDLYNPVLDLDGHGSGRIADGLDFLRDTPLGEYFGEPLAPVQLDGEMGLDLSIQMPLEAPDTARVDGYAELSGGRGGADWLPGEVSELEGVLEFTEKGVRTDELRARHFGGDIIARIDPGSAGRDAAEDAPEWTEVSLVGHSRISEVRAALPDLRILQMAEGGQDWTGRVRVPNEPDTGDIRVRFLSDLVGTAIALPEPVGKAAEASRRLQVDFALGFDTTRVEALYGQDTAAVIGVDADAEVTGVRVHHGEPMSPAPLDSGLRVSGRLETLQLDEWLALEDRVEVDRALALEEVALQVERLHAGPISLHEQGFRLSPVGDLWRLELEGEDATGTAHVPTDLATSRGTISAEMDHFRLRHRTEEGDGAEEWRPERLPGLDLEVAALALNSEPLGALEMRLRPRPDGIVLEDLRLDSDILTGRVSGAWLADPVTGAQRGHLHGDFGSTDVGEVLRRAGLLPGLEAQLGELQANLHWTGPPGMAALPGLGGQVSLNLEGGALREVQPGAGRLLGLLSVSALPRRLFGDFRDVFGEGLSFDTITGDFYLVDGNAYTGNLSLAGPGGDARIRGRTGLVSQDYDQIMTVEAPVGAVLPVAGALAGGTGVGAALLVVSEVFSGPLGRMGQAEYQVRGSWDEPLVFALDDDGEEDGERQLGQETD